MVTPRCSSTNQSGRASTLRHKGVDEAAQPQDEGAVAHHLDPLGHGPGHDGRRRADEGHVPEPVDVGADDLEGHIDAWGEGVGTYDGKGFAPPPVKTRSGCEVVNGNGGQT